MSFTNIEETKWKESGISVYRKLEYEGGNFIVIGTKATEQFKTRKVTEYRVKFCSKEWKGALPIKDIREYIFKTKQEAVEAIQKVYQTYEGEVIPLYISEIEVYYKVIV